MRVMQHASEKENGGEGLPSPPYKAYNIGNFNSENLLDFVPVLREGLTRANVLSEDYNFETHKELVLMQSGDVPVTYAVGVGGFRIQTEYELSREFKKIFRMVL